MSPRHFISITTLIVFATGCSEAVDDGGTDDDDSTMACDPGANGSGGAAGDGGSSGESPAGPGSTTGAGGGASGLVLNELSASGDDWIELFNGGTETLDLGGLAIADADDAGEPKVDDAVTIPAGTTLASGAYLFILADQDASLPDFQDACDPGPAPCLHAGFGISGGGDTLFVLDAEGAVIASVVYPADATADGESWARLPNGTGDFGVAAPTPGAANAGP